MAYLICSCYFLTNNNGAFNCIKSHVVWWCLYLDVKMSFYLGTEVEPLANHIIMYSSSAILCSKIHKNMSDLTRK